MLTLHRQNCIKFEIPNKNFQETNEIICAFTPATLLPKYNIQVLKLLFLMYNVNEERNREDTCEMR